MFVVSIRVCQRGQRSQRSLSSQRSQRSQRGKVCLHRHHHQDGEHVKGQHVNGHHRVFTEVYLIYTTGQVSVLWGVVLNRV